MPDDYYVSQYSGEEIDALLGGAGAGTVRYDAAQSLTDAQKQQARTNIAAAPSGFGLGGEGNILYNVDANECVSTGWYAPGKNTPVEGIWIIRTDAAIGAIRQTAYAISNSNGVPDYVVCRRNYSKKQWQPWEYVNPPMQLSVEYRTTERYLGKPVYCKLIDCGKFPAPGSSKQIAHGISNCRPISITGQMSNANTVPYIGYYTIGADATSITLASVSSVSDLSAHNTVALMRYIKTTD